MQNLPAVHLPTWEIALPPDWSKQSETEEGEMYFESEDGTKGLSIATWRMGEDTANGSAAQVSQSFRQSALASLEAMEGYTWQVLADESAMVGPVSIVLTDAWAASRSPRPVPWTSKGPRR